MAQSVVSDQQAPVTDLIARTKCLFQPKGFYEFPQNLSSRAKPLGQAQVAHSLRLLAWLQAFLGLSQLRNA